MAGHSQDSHPESLISRIFNLGNEPSVSNDSMDAIETENSNITKVVGGISNQTKKIQENADNFWIGKWSIFF